MKNSQRLTASFRDPSDFIFRHNGTLYWQINTTYAGPLLAVDLFSVASSYINTLIEGIG